MQGASSGDAESAARPLALYSCPVGPTCVARSRHQLVGFNWQAHTFDSVWQVRSRRRKAQLAGAWYVLCKNPVSYPVTKLHGHLRRCAPGLHPSMNLHCLKQ